MEAYYILTCTITALHIGKDVLLFLAIKKCRFIIVVFNKSNEIQTIII